MKRGLPGERIEHGRRGPGCGVDDSRETWIVADVAGAPEAAAETLNGGIVQVRREPAVVDLRRFDHSVVIAVFPEDGVGDGGLNA